MLHLFPVVVAEVTGASLYFHFLQVLVQVSVSESFTVGLVLLSKHLDIMYVIEPKYTFDLDYKNSVQNTVLKICYLTLLAYGLGVG